MINLQNFTNVILHNIKFIRRGRVPINKLQWFHEHNQNDLDTIERLEKDVFFFLGKDGNRLVNGQRYPVNHRYSTIAKTHLKSAHKKSFDDFVHESRALIHHFNTHNEKDSAIAVGMLMPADEKYWLARKQYPAKK